MQLGDRFKELSRRGCEVLLSNSNTEEVRKIYQGCHLQKVEALRAISCKADSRKGHTELIINNYTRRQL